jgi:hypothetical protein
MSRGPGMMQRYLFSTISIHGKPVTFGELRDIILKADGAPAGAELRPPIERSLRRALHSLVSEEILIALGSGGRADPHRYSLNPIVVAMAGGDFDAVIAALEADRRR